MDVQNVRVSADLNVHAIDLDRFIVFLDVFLVDEMDSNP